MKWYVYIICAILSLVGIYCSITLVQDITSASYKVGSASIANQFSQESFFYSNSAVAFYPNEGAEAYTFEIELLEVENFNAQENEYGVKLNDYILFNSKFTAGSVAGDITMYFYDVDGGKLHEANMQIVIQFLSSKTKLKMACDSQTSANYFEKYFADNGIRLSVERVK